MRIQDIIDAWAQPNDSLHKQNVSHPHLPIELAAKLAALHEIYPQRSEAELASDLITHALAQMQQMSEIQH